MNASERDELLIRVDERTENLTKQFANHLKHHWAMTLAAWAAALACAGSIAAGVVFLAMKGTP